MPALWQDSPTPPGSPVIKEAWREELATVLQHHHFLTSHNTGAALYKSVRYKHTCFMLHMLQKPDVHITVDMLVVGQSVEVSDGMP